ncbi:BREX-1 system phosphatase PglZ type A [Clostridium sp. FP2]|uniref:BREX-1 system phosphatase PglZ type A n=1 Tax=Clostridium sp. FP2 TaxID=2724481 RepID=UPI0013E9560D|nr:BREX-1 system phosphatase PglZ type A [Clostridium sp. FP2]MBZ9624412.1 BREX-1 system phosphatase PglZ type A [Clostridium sp. FP2]
MDLIEKLVEKFNDCDPRKIVFWYDKNSDRDVDALIIELEKNNIKLFRITENNSFKTRCQVEILDKDSDYLLYGDFERPNKKENPLLDILLYSEEFNADDVALIIDRYHLEHLNMRDFIKSYIGFFNDNKRCKKLESLLPDFSSEEELILGILCVLSKANSLNIEDVVKAVLIKGFDENDNEAYEYIRKFFSLDIFWKKVYSYFGINSEEKSLKLLMDTIIYCHFTSNLKIDFTKDFKHMFNSTLPNTCNIFLEDFMKYNKGTSVIKEYINSLEIKWDIGNLLKKQSYFDYYKCHTFKVIEQFLVLKSIEEMFNETVNYELWKEILSYRRSSFWMDDEGINSNYKILSKALELYNEKLKFGNQYAPENVIAWAKQYSEQLYKVDRFYRNLISEFKNANQPEILFKTVEYFTSWYSNYYLEKVAEWTDEIVNKELASNYFIDKMLMQKDFYGEKIKPLMDKTTERVFVIISDAFRYEIAKELEEELKKRINSEVEVIPALASIPTYTQLGMASLLPNNEFSIDENGVVYIDGLSTMGTENRQKILKSYQEGSLAMKLNQLTSLSKLEGLEIIKGKRLVYLYHDRIDKTGDSSASEAYTYEAVEAGIDELKNAMQKLLGSYGAVRIFVTSDHGFIYQSEKIEEKYKAIAVNGNIFDGNRRFVIGKDLIVTDGTKKMNLNYIGLNAETVIATGLNRFKVKGGGLRFIHGGAMPQEAIIPVLCYKENKGVSKRKEEQKVDINIASSRTITSYNFKVIFFQEQKVDDKLSKRILKAGFYQGENRISDEGIFVFGSMEEASKRIVEKTFIFQEKSYIVGENVVLRLEDIESSKSYKDIQYEFKIYDSF